MALITPEKLAASGSEDGSQKAYIQACRLYLQERFPEVRLTYHVPNGGQRGDAAAASRTMSNMKSMGLVAGVPDICLPVSRCHFSNLYIEFKKPDGKGRLDIDQFKFIRLLANNGNLVAICDDWQHAYQITEEYLSRSDSLYLLTNQLPFYGIAQNKVIDASEYIEKFINSAVWKRYIKENPSEA